MWKCTATNASTASSFPESETRDKGKTMKLTDAEIAAIRTLGLYVTEKCDTCMKPLNQTYRYTVTGKPQTYCSQPCRDGVKVTPGLCAYCESPLVSKRRGSLFCNDRCRKRLERANPTSPLVRDTVHDAATRNNADTGPMVSMV